MIKHNHTFLLLDSDMSLFYAALQSSIFIYRASVFEELG